MGTDYRSMFDRDFIGAWDLAGRDVTITIESVRAGELNNGRQKNKKPIVKIVGREKGFALNKTNAKIIAAMYGNDVSKWEGKKITIYPTKANFGNEVMDAIRVRPGIPSERSNGNRSQQQPRTPTNDWREVLGLSGDNITKQDVEDAYAQLHADAQDDAARIALLSSARGFAMKEVGDDDSSDE